MKPSELNESEQFNIETPTTRICFMREYTVLTVWATGRPKDEPSGVSGAWPEVYPDPEHYVQITPSDDEEKIDEFYNNLIVMNPHAKVTEG